MERKCVNTACEHHRKGRCDLFPGEWGWLKCNFSDQKTETKNNTKKGKK